MPEHFETELTTSELVCPKNRVQAPFGMELWVPAIGSGLPERAICSVEGGKYFHFIMNRLWGTSWNGGNYRV